MFSSLFYFPTPLNQLNIISSETFKTLVIDLITCLSKDQLKALLDNISDSSLEEIMKALVAAKARKGNEVKQSAANISEPIVARVNKIVKYAKMYPGYEISSKRPFYEWIFDQDQKAFALGHAPASSVSTSANAVGAFINASGRTFIPTHCPYVQPFFERCKAARSARKGKSLQYYVNAKAGSSKDQ